MISPSGLGPALNCSQTLSARTYAAHAPDSLVGDPGFLIRRDHVGRQARFIRADLYGTARRQSHRCSITVRLKLQTAPLHALANPLSNLRCVFPNPASEHDGIGAI